MVEELGDLLLQVVMHAEIASETDRFVLEDMPEAWATNWSVVIPTSSGERASDTRNGPQAMGSHQAQRKRRQTTSISEGCGEGLPALMTATKLQKKAAKVGFDWTTRMRSSPK